MATRKTSGVLQIHLPERWPDMAAAREPMFRWARHDGSRTERGFSSLREIPAAGTVIAVAPASRVLAVRVRLPNARAARQEKVLAYLVEDAIGSSPEDIHALAAGESIDGAKVVLVVDRAWLKSAWGELDIQGFGPSRLVCESELLAESRPVDQRVWTVVCTPTGGFVHMGGVEHAAIDPIGDNPAVPPMALNLALDEHTRAGTSPDTIEVRIAEGVPMPDLARWSHALALPVTRAPDWQPEGMDARACTKTNLLNVLPGRRSDEVSWFERYKPAAILAAVIVVAHGTLTIADWWRMSAESSRLRAGMEERFLKIFPDSKVVDAPRQMEQLLRNLKRTSGEMEPGDYVALLGRVAPLLAGANATTKSVKYERGQLTIDATFPGGDSRDALEARLKAPGVKVQVERVQPGAGGVQAAIKVTPA
jgi:type II secretion system protein L